MILAKSLTISRRFLVLSVLMAAKVFGQARGGGTLDVVTLSENVPPGAAVQVKHTFGSHPTPITSGGTDFALDSFSVDGVALFSPQGDAAGVAVIQNQALHISMISPNSDLGLAAYDPFLAITLIPGSAPTGSTFSLDLFANSTFQSPAGPITLIRTTPGTLTMGGSVSIRSVYPGGGTWPVGTVITVEGTGFQPDTKLTTKDTKLAEKIIGTPAFVSPTEMTFTLNQAATLDMQAFNLVNPDGSEVTFFSYTRGVPVWAPSRPLLMNTDPLFPTLTRASATIGPLPALSDGQFEAVAIQNPNPDTVVVSFHLERTGITTTVTLPSGGRVMDDLAVLLGGTDVNAGDVVAVSATSGVQILGLRGDENAGTVTPILPSP